MTVAAYAPPGVGMLAVGIVTEVFGGHGDTAPGFDFALCTDRPGPVPTDLGVPLTLTHGLDRLASADLVIALPWAGFRTPPAPAVLDALSAAHERGAMVAAHCVGAFALAAAGLLDGRRATTHWRFAPCWPAATLKSPSNPTPSTSTRDASSQAREPPRASISACTC